MLLEAPLKAKPCSARPALNRSDLHDYQRRAVDFMHHNPRCALWLDMGLGKTVSVLTYLADLYAAGSTKRTLIIAPKRVALHTWPTEISKWQHTQHLDYSLLIGTARQRFAAAEQRANLHIINTDNVKWLCDYIRWHYDTVIIDESSLFKAPSAKRFKALRKVIGQATRVVALTGTPASNGYLDLWSQYALIDGGKRLGNAFYAYRQRYFYPDYFGYNWTLRDTAKAAIENRITDITLCMQAEEHIALPSRIDNTISVDLPTKARQAYDTLLKQFLIEYDNGADVVASSAAVLVNKLHQAANGFLYDEDGNTIPLHTAKLDALEDVITAQNGKPLLVAYSFKADLAAIQQRFPQAVSIDAPDAVTQWNNGEVLLLLAHPQSAGHGLNLQDGGHQLCWFSLPWSLEQYDQFNARLHRQGQQHAVVVHHLIAQNTVDEQIITALHTKDFNQKALLNAIKEKAQ